MRYSLTDAEWGRIDPITPCTPREAPRVDDRRVVDGTDSVTAAPAPVAPQFRSAEPDAPYSRLGEANGLLG